MVNYFSNELSIFFSIFIFFKIKNLVILAYKLKEKKWQNWQQIPSNFKKPFKVLVSLPFLGNRFSRIKHQNRMQRQLNSQKRLSQIELKTTTKQVTFSQKY